MLVSNKIMEPVTEKKKDVDAFGFVFFNMNRDYQC